MDANQDAETTFTIEMALAYPHYKAVYDAKIITWERLVAMLHNFYLIGYGKGMQAVGEKIDEMEAERDKR